MVIVLCPISSCTVRRYTPFITKRLANVCRRSSGVSSVSLGKTHRLLSRLGRALNLISSPPALSIQQSLYRHEHRSALVLDQEHQEFRRLGTACVPVNDMNIVGAFIEGLSWCQCYLFSTLHLHHNGALQYVNNRMCIVSVDRARPAGRMLYCDHQNFPAGILRKIFRHERRDLRLLSHRRAGHEAWQNQRNEFGRHSRLFRSSPETPGCNALLGYFRDHRTDCVSAGTVGEDPWMQDQALACERRSHSSRPTRPTRASPNGTSERSSPRP